MLGAIEAGGTKFVCAVGNEQGHIFEKKVIPTTIPDETMPLVIEFFNQYPLTAIGVGSFGPIDINGDSQTYGYITSTPKPGWRDYPIVQTLKDAFAVPIVFNTDVNAAALGEATFGVAKGLDSCLYITVGTGIGAGAIIQGKLLQGLSHPEMGHVLIRRHPNDPYQGSCPYHKDCLEGVASGPSLEKRWGLKGNELVDKDEVWDLEGYYLAQALMQFVLTLSPKKIILGGGVMNQKQIFPHLYKYLEEFLNQYVNLPELSKYIVSPGLGDESGIKGALILAQRYQARPEY